jgi:hypothetical protein
MQIVGVVSIPRPPQAICMRLRFSPVPQINTPPEFRAAYHVRARLSYVCRQRVAATNDFSGTDFSNAINVFPRRYGRRNGRNSSLSIA